MKELKIIYKSDKEKIIEKLGYYGIKELNFLLVESGKEKIRGYTGSLSIEELNKLNKEVGIELVGMYLFHNYGEEIRLSLDALNVLKKNISKNVLEVNEQQAQDFLKGRDIMLKKGEFENETKGFKIIKHKEDFIGVGKLLDGRIANYMPKERRLR